MLARNRGRARFMNRSPKLEVLKIGTQMGPAKIIALSIDERSRCADCGVTTANERTFLAYLRTSLVFSMLGVLIAQLYRLQHSPSPGVVFGYYLLSLPLSILFQCAAVLILLLGCIRFYRQQAAMARGKVRAGGWDLYTLMGCVFMVCVCDQVESTTFLAIITNTFCDS
jgi:uncharacterized membrane protein YidH (DUF202 family)